jgi:hypothetical protein
MRYNKIYILGYGAKNRNQGDYDDESTGKDYAAEYLNKHLGLTFESSSYFACQRFLFPQYGDQYGYVNADEMFLDRHNGGNRRLWYGWISEINREDPCTLSEAMFDNFNIYVGLRNYRELLAMKEKYPDDLLSIWIDASERIEPEDSTSCTVTAEMCDFTILNNGTIAEYENKLQKLIGLLRD